MVKTVNSEDQIKGMYTYGVSLSIFHDTMGDDIKCVVSFPRLPAKETYLVDVNRGLFTKMQIIHGNEYNTMIDYIVKYEMANLASFLRERLDTGMLPVSDFPPRSGLSINLASFYKDLEDEISDYLKAKDKDLEPVGAEGGKSLIDQLLSSAISHPSLPEDTIYLLSFRVLKDRNGNLGDDIQLMKIENLGMLS